MRQCPMIVTSGLKAHDNRAGDCSQIISQAVIISFRGHHGHTPPATALGAFNQNLLAVLGHINGYQNGIIGSRITLGHDRSVSKVLSR